MPSKYQPVPRPRVSASAKKGFRSRPETLLVCALARYARYVQVLPALLIDVLCAANVLPPLVTVPTEPAGKSAGFTPLYWSQIISSRPPFALAGAWLGASHMSYAASYWLTLLTENDQSVVAVPRLPTVLPP